MITRHGDAPKDDNGMSMDSLIAESVGRLYDQGQQFNEAELGGIDTSRILVRHSDKKRTISTAKARIAGIRGLSKPEDEEDLANYVFDGVRFDEDADRVGYRDLKLNMALAGEIGFDAYQDRWLADPDAATMGGEEITPFNELIRTRTPVLADVINEMHETGIDFAIVSGHGALSEAMTMGAANTARARPIRTYNTIGGLYPVEGYSALVMDTDTETGKTEGRIIRPGEGISLPVDVEALRRVA